MAVAKATVASKKDAAVRTHNSNQSPRRVAASRETSPTPAQRRVILLANGDSEVLEEPRLPRNNTFSPRKQKKAPREESPRDCSPSPEGTKEASRNHAEGEATLPSPREEVVRALERHFLPASILPNSKVESFTIDAKQKFILKLQSPGAKTVGSSRVHYSSVITGTMQVGMLIHLRGVGMEDSVLKVPVRIPVRRIYSQGPASRHVSFYTGIITREHQVLKKALSG